MASRFEPVHALGYDAGVPCSCYCTASACTASIGAASNMRCSCTVLLSGVVIGCAAARYCQSQGQS